MAKNVRTPQYRPRVEQDKRWQERLKDVEKQEQVLPGEPDDANSDDNQVHEDHGLDDEA